MCSRDTELIFWIPSFFKCKYYTPIQLYYIIVFLQRPSLDVLLGKKYPHLVNSNLEHGFYFVHRLDFVTSGVLCIALNKRACAKASGAIQKRISRKYYIALVRGHVSKDRLDLTDSIGNRLCNEIYEIHLYLILLQSNLCYY